MQRRHQILDAASRLLLHHGPGKTTVSDIARAAGVGVGSVYLEFKSKDEILIALSSSRYQTVLDAMRDAAAAESCPAERVRAVLRARLEAFLTLAEGGAHAPDLLHCYCPAVEAAWQRFAEAEAEILGGVLETGVNAGLLCGEPVPCAHLVLRACATLSPPLLCTRRPPNVRAMAEQLYALILDGLRRR